MIKINELKKIEDLEIENGLLDVEYDEHFQSMLDSDQITPKWVEENAIWMRMAEESEEAYSLFTKYVALPIDKWSFKDLHDDDVKVQHYMNIYHWRKRRLLYLKYKEWFEKRKSELEHLEAISLYRDTQAKVLKSTTESALTLIQKLQKRIDTMDAEDIDPRNIPQFISALSTFVGLASDAEARALAVDSLLKLHAEELSSLNLSEHMAAMSANKENYIIE
jgi:hypothetical protein